MRSRLILILAVLVAFLAPVSGADAFETTAKAAIIIDYRTGAVLFEKNADERMPPASMSKLMTAFMVFDRLKNGRLKLDEEVLVSERAWKMGGSQMFLEVGERVKIPDALVPADARVEIEAKIAAGYFTDGQVPGELQLAAVKGRGLE